MPLTRVYIAIILLLALLLSACRSEKSTALSGIHASEHDLITAFSSGTISRDREIRIRFSQDADTSEWSGTSKLAEVIKMVPVVTGQWIWTDKNELVFKPQDLWPSASAIRVQIEPGPITGNSDRNDVCYFEVFTGTPAISVHIDMLESDLRSGYNLKGHLSSTDVLLPGELERLLEVEMENVPYEINWDVEENSGLWFFTIKGLERGELSRNLVLKIMALEELGNEGSERSLRIPGKNEMAILDHRIEMIDPRGVIIVFSDPLDPSQELEGLIKIQDLPTSFRLIRDGQTVLVIPEEFTPGSYNVQISGVLRNEKGITLGRTETIRVHFSSAPPEIKWLTKGNLLPLSSGGQVSFEATNLKAVHLEIFRIREQNILQYLQENRWGGDYYLDQVGYVVHRARIPLMDQEASRDKETGAYTLDLSSWIDREPNAMYELRLGFYKEDAITSCQWSETNESSPDTKWPGDSDPDASFWNYNYYGQDGYYEGFEWTDRDDPCKPAYYNRDRFISLGVFPVEIGLIVKGSDNGGYLCAVTSLETGRPLSGVSVKWYNYQQELLGETTTDPLGMSRYVNETEQEVFFVTADNGKYKSVLRVPEGESQLLSAFDIDGKSVRGGRDVFIYGERDVWRPGDSIFLFAMFRQLNGKAWEKVPVRYRFRDPMGKLMSEGTLDPPASPLFPVFLKTGSEAMTGTWSLQLAMGDEVYSHPVAVESLKPNKFKFLWKEMEAPVYSWTSGQHEVNVQWLYGAPAKGVPVLVEMKNSPLKDPFPKFKDYEFHDPGNEWSTQKVLLGEGTTLDDGSALIKRSAGVPLLSGPANSRWTLRAGEPGGGFSVDQITKRIFPFKSYAGVKVPLGRDGYPVLELNRDNPLNVVRVDAEGEGIPGQLHVEIYKVNWRWWWDQDSGNDWNYSSRELSSQIQKKTIQVNGTGNAVVQFNPVEWGRYMIKVCDPVSGHCAAHFAYAGSPDFADLDRSEASRIQILTDKESYAPGDIARINIPSAFDGMALLTIENGSGVLDASWHKIQTGQNEIEIQVSEKLTPAVYAHISLIQALNDIRTDIPVRMYGVVHFKVNRSSSRLALKVDVPDELKANNPIEVRVREASGRPMHYTIALVDEGLLNLTRFPTPDPWAHFHEKEALGVKTWDMYDDLVLSPASLSRRILAVGGDRDILPPEGQQDANRFPPVVKVLGPFALGKGAAGKHLIQLPEYLGSVRVMVVACTEEAWGSWDKSVTVTSPVMLFSSAPRVLAPGDEWYLPLTIIRGKGASNADVEWQLNDRSGLISFPEKKNGRLSLGPGEEETVFVPIETGDGTGWTEIELAASLGQEKVTSSLRIPVRNPDPLITDQIAYTIPPGESIIIDYNALGSDSESDATLELMQLTPFSMQDKLDYLLNYPHGCLEQIVSQAFAQLFIPSVTKLSKEQSSLRSGNIQSVIQRMHGFLNASGHFSMWPGNREHHPWTDVYAAHFLYEAKERGFRVPEEILAGWRLKTRKLAVRWTPQTPGEGQIRRADPTSQSYRLYLLARMGKAEKGAMNLLKEQSALGKEALYLLAAAYAVIGRDKDCDEILARAVKAEDVGQFAENYTSESRQLAIALLSFAMRKDDTRALQALKRLSDIFNEKKYMTTQEAGFAMLALGNYMEMSPLSSSMEVKMQIDGKDQLIKSAAAIELVNVPDPSKDHFISIGNNGNSPVFVFLNRVGRPAGQFSKAKSNGLSLSVRYADSNGIPVEKEALSSGKEFQMIVSLQWDGLVSRNELRDLALSTVVPAGWELLDNQASSVDGNVIMRYEDRRDDRINLYFDMLGPKVQFSIRFRAAYPGNYYLPPIHAEAMYEPFINGHTASGKVSVVK